MDEELKKLFEVRAELDARELNVSEMTPTELMLYELVLHMRYMRGLATERHYTNKKCTGIIAPGRAYGQTQFV